MAIDSFSNFAKADLASGITSGATSLSVVSGYGAKFPAVPFNATVWNATDYADPSDDPEVELVRVTVKATDTFTITRGQEGTSAASHNTAGKTYRIIATLTAKTLSDIATILADASGKERRFAFTGSVVYCGTAPLDSVESASVWTIQRLTVASSGVVTPGIALNASWTNRASETYT